MGQRSRTTKLSMYRLLAILIAIAFTPPVFADELEGDYLYKVTTARAATGTLSDLLVWIEKLKATDYFTEVRTGAYGDEAFAGRSMGSVGHHANAKLGHVL